MKSTAPWTPEQVLRLSRWQTCGTFHPFTCPHRGDGKHKVLHGDLGVLTPTMDGWRCISCSYTQDWAHDFMLNDEPQILGNLR